MLKKSAKNHIKQVKIQIYINEGVLQPPIYNSSFLTGGGAGA